jgi:hypothetical protein
MLTLAVTLPLLCLIVVVHCCCCGQSRNEVCGESRRRVEYSVLIRDFVGWLMKAAAGETAWATDPGPGGTRKGAKLDDEEEEEGEEEEEEERLWEEGDGAGARRQLELLLDRPRE